VGIFFYHLSNLDSICFGYNIRYDVIPINEDKEIYHIHTQLGKCDNCQSKELIIHRIYSGEKLCTTCFVNSIEKNISATISKYKMLKPQDKIVVAVSGGKDSLSLLYNINKIQKRKFRSKPIIALTIDEGITGYRNKSIECAKNFCKRYNIEHIVLNFKDIVGKTLDEIITIKKNDPDYQYACNYCAVYRRRILNEGARELDADVLVMGHNLTDLAETYLMNVLFKRHQMIANQYLFKRESNEIRKCFVKKVTPLMKIPEEEIFLYSNLKKFDYFPSHCPYREQDPILRKRVLEFIQKIKSLSPEIEFNLLKGFLEISEILYHNFEKKSYNICKRCGYPCGRNDLCLYCRYIDNINK
jgi:uncharacterized protein (TIGR00269 family)